MATDNRQGERIGTTSARTRADVAHSTAECGTLTVFAYNGVAVPYAGFTHPVAPDISMGGTSGSARMVIVDSRGWKEAKSRPRSWR